MLWSKKRKVVWRINIRRELSAIIASGANLLLWGIWILAHNLCNKHWELCLWCKNKPRREKLFILPSIHWIKHNWGWFPLLTTRFNQPVWFFSYTHSNLTKQWKRRAVHKFKTKIMDLWVLFVEAEDIIKNLY